MMPSLAPHPVSPRLHTQGQPSDQVLKYLAAQLWTVLLNVRFLQYIYKINQLKHQSRLQQTTFINIFHRFSEKIRLDVAFFSLKDKSKRLTCRLLQFLFGTLRVNISHRTKKLNNID